MKKITAILALGLLLVSACDSAETEVEASAPATPGVVALANTTCPVMGLEVMDGEFLEWEGYRINLCCPGCDETFLSDPEKYMGILAEDPSVSADLSAFLPEEGIGGCASGSCNMVSEECPDCTDEELCEACETADAPAACHTE